MTDLRSRLEAAIRAVPDFPKPGILFRDITPVLEDPVLCRDITEGFLSGSDVLRLAATKDQDTRDKLTELQAAFAEYQLSVATILGNLQNFIADCLGL